MFRHSMLLSIRMMATRYPMCVAATSVLSLLAACATTHTASSSGSTSRPAGSLALTVPSLAGAPGDVSVYVQRAAGDTVPRLVSRLTTTAAAVSDHRVQFTKDWAPPFQSSDTLTVEAATLRPRQEVLTFNKVRREYHYDGAHVTGSIQYPDSAPRSYDTTFDAPVFAFNEVEPLVRSLMYRTGFTVVVPLFSEVDAALEHDTLSVIGQARETGADAWVVRFADPVITTRYLVDARSRAILDAVTTQRKSGMRFHYAYATRAGG